jgi:hypothetical protein
VNKRFQRARTTNQVVVLLFFFVCFPAESSQNGDPIQRRSVPDDGIINITDYGYRDWAPEPVNYLFDSGRIDSDAVSVVDERGRSVPVQVEDNVLTFMASVPTGGTSRFTVKNEVSSAATELRIVRTGTFLEVGNEHIALRLPVPGTLDFGNGVAASKVHGPLVSWTAGGERFIGSSRFVTPRKVAGVTYAVVRDGPVVFEYDARYRFEPAGAYRFNLRLSPGMPLAIITEEFDFEQITSGEDLLVLDLHAGWRPDEVHRVKAAGEKPLPMLESVSIEDYFENGKNNGGTRVSVGGVGREPRPYPPWNGALLLDKIVPGARWGEFKGGIMFSGPDDAEPMAVGLAPLHVGAWRRAMALNVWRNEQGGVSISLPISVRRIQWPLDIADDLSPFSTHEHDRTLAETYGRRVWGLHTGKEFELAQARYGYIGLDRYKDWQVDYPEGENSYPGVFYSPRHIELLKSSIDEHPDREVLREWFLLSGRSEDAKRHAEQVIKWLSPPDRASRFFLAGLSHYRQAQSLSDVLMAEDALADPDLDPGLRSELRLRLALHANLMSEPDFNPRDSGVHLGNNNMTINRTLALTYFAGLLQDHPRHRYWMDRVEQYLRFKFSTQTSPDGPWIASPSYQLYSPTRAMNISQNVLRNLGFHDFSEEGYLYSTLRYLAWLTVPDVRYESRRIIPGMGNSSNRIESIWGVGMAAVIDRHPDRAAFLRQMFLGAMGDEGILGPRERPWRVVDDVEAYAPYYLPVLQPKNQQMKTVFLPSYGVVFRNQSGQGESALLLRAGMNWSHWDTDALNAILYSRGVPLSPGTAYAYYNGPAVENNGIYHNQVKLGRRDLQEVFGRVDGAVADYGFGPNADYAVAERFYPSQLFDDGESAKRWRRHVLFAKTNEANSSDYFVMRDTFPGGEHLPKWWNWMNLGDADRVLVGGNPFEKSEVPFNLNVAEPDMPVLTGREIELNSGFNASTWIRFSRNRQVRARMTFDYRRGDWFEGNETKSIIEVPAGPGEDFFYLVYPRHGGTPLPKVHSPAAGVMEVAHTEVSDTVFVADHPFNYERKGIVFTGKSGIVRVYHDRVVLAMTSGSGRIGYEGHIIEGHGPFEQVVALNDLRRGVHTMPTGYEKSVQRLDLGRGVVLTGEGPFSARLDGDRVHIDTDGRQRVIFVSQPDFITRPQYTIDGVEWMASWTDYPNSGWGAYDETWKIGLSIPAGRHRLTLENMTFPPAWSRGFEPGL